jgi:hypothetical protein
MSGGGRSRRRTRLGDEFPGIREFCWEIGASPGACSGESHDISWVFRKTGRSGQGIEIVQIREKFCRFSEVCHPEFASYSSGRIITLTKESVEEDVRSSVAQVDVTRAPRAKAESWYATDRTPEDLSRAACG